jgi:hypothetical protein
LRLLERSDQIDMTIARHCAKPSRYSDRHNGQNMSVERNAEEVSLELRCGVRVIIGIETR